MLSEISMKFLDVFYFFCFVESFGEFAIYCVSVLDSYLSAVGRRADAVERFEDFFFEQEAVIVGGAVFLFPVGGEIEIACFADGFDCAEIGRASCRERV